MCELFLTSFKGTAKAPPGAPSVGVTGAVEHLEDAMPKSPSPAAKLTPLNQMKT